ncbi:MAG: hypothetical protein WCY84_01445 [Candidatus Cloacimonadaceae bacterium]
MIQQSEAGNNVKQNRCFCFDTASPRGLGTPRLTQMLQTDIRKHPFSIQNYYSGQGVDKMGFIFGLTLKTNSNNLNLQIDNRAQKKQI